MNGKAMKNEVKIERWERMENFSEFFPMLKGMLESIYGSAEKGLKIYKERYDAINYYRKYQMAPNSFLLIAKKNNKIVGFLYARRKRNHTYLYDIFVKPEHCKQGIARRMIETLEKLAGKPIRADTHEGALKALKGWTSRS